MSADHTSQRRQQLFTRGSGDDEPQETFLNTRLQAKPGRRDELKGLLESMVANHGPSQRGFLGSTRYEVLDDPDTLIEIAEWESAEARVAHMQEGAATGAYAPLLDVLAAPFRATVIRQLP